VVVGTETRGDIKIKKVVAGIRSIPAYIT